MPLDGDEDSWPGWELPRWELPPMDIMYWPGLQEAGETRCYGPGETVIPAGRPPDCVQVIDEGLVRVTAPAGRGGDAFLRACGPGEVLGEELLLPLGGRPGGRRIGAVALTACTTLAVSRAAVRACLSDRPQLWEGLAQDLIRRVAEDEERIMRLACDPVGVRLAWLLVRLVRSCDAVEDDGALGLPVNLSDADLALWIGAGRTSVETALKEWRSRGVVARRHGKLVITNPDPLIKMADIPADRRAVTQPRTPAWRLARPAGRHGAAVERPAGRHVGATAARTGNHAARGGRPGCGRPRAALAGASAWRCRPPSPRTREPSERARTAWARYPAGAPAPSQGFGQRGRAREYPADLPNQANAGRCPLFPGTTPCRLDANLDEPAGVPCPARPARQPSGGH